MIIRKEDIMIIFTDWYFLAFLLIIPFIILWTRRKDRVLYTSIKYSNFKSLREIVGIDSAKRKVYLLKGIKLFSIVLLILALARPQKGLTEKEFITKGIDIMLVVDISGSMRAADFQPNRLEAVKAVARKFINERHNDRIGLIVFGAVSFLQCPLTVDYGILNELLNRVTFVDEKYDGTAIGMALAHAVNRLKGSQSVSKIVILLSDGRNNAGELDPLTAADMAQAYGIKVYTIGAGRRGKAPYPVVLPDGSIQYRMVDVEIDEELLQKMAEMTGGKYFRATDERSLEKIYDEINSLEKSDIKVKEYMNFKDLYHLFLFPAIMLFVMGFIFERNVWRVGP